MIRQASRVPKYPNISQLNTRGTFYDVGYNVGVTFTQQIQLFFLESDNIQDKLLPFYDSRPGRQYCEEMVRVAQDCFPQYVREIHGIADGAGMPFEHVFMANVSKEVNNILYYKWKADGGTTVKGAPSKASGTPGQHRPESAPFREDFSCSDVFINRPGYQYIIHNEDCDPRIKPYGYMLQAEIEEGDVKEQFTSYSYPGFLQGSCASFNQHGLTISIDGLYPDHIAENCPGRLFINRSMLRARDVEDAVRLARNEPYGSAYGFCANVSSSDGRMVAIEVGPSAGRALVHVHDVVQQTDPSGPCHYYHFNSYKHLTQVSVIDSMISSTLRTKRAGELPPPRNRQEALTVLADTHDPLGPIFRTPRPTDPMETVCTIAFDLTNRQVYYYQGREDLLSDRAFFKLPMYQ